MSSQASSELRTRAETDSNSGDKPELAESSATRTLMGQISFINTMPVTLPLLQKAVDIGCKLVFDTPAALNKKLNENELNLGAMSSFFYLEHGGFELFDRISISGTGKVGSVLLFSKDELGHLSNKKILVPDSSATSIKLMQVLLKSEFGLDVELIENPCPDETDEFLRKDTAIRAQLVIGDKALKLDEQLGNNSPYLRIDLAQWWYKQFSLPFVFGVWGARKEWAVENQGLFEEIGNSLRAARDLGLTSMLKEVIDESSKLTGFSESRLKCYYIDELDYRLDDEHKQALALFEKLCRENGFLAQK